MTSRLPYNLIRYPIQLENEKPIACKSVIPIFLANLIPGLSEFSSKEFIPTPRTSQSDHTHFYHKKPFSTSTRHHGSFIVRNIVTHFFYKKHNCKQGYIAQNPKKHLGLSSQTWCPTEVQNGSYIKSVYKKLKVTLPTLPFQKYSRNFFTCKSRKS